MTGHRKMDPGYTMLLFHGWDDELVEQVLPAG
jgi:hypothetical protein